MAKNTIDDVYGSRVGVDFAKYMAEALLKPQQTDMPSAEMAKLPGTWMYSVPNILKAISGAGYRNIAGSQDKTLADRRVDPSTPNPLQQGYGRIEEPAITRERKQNRTDYHGTAKKMYLGGNPDATGAMPENNIAPFDSKVSTRVGADTRGDDYYANEVKKSENAPLFAGKKAKDRAVWDYKQHSIGFGTTAKHRGEEIDGAEAHARFAEEWAKSQELVDKFHPGLPAGPRAALTSLTFNAGTTWMKQGLGMAIKNGDMAKAKAFFTQYVNAGGKPLAGLKSRRQREAQWFDHTDAPAEKSQNRLLETGSITPEQDEKQLLSDANPDAMKVGDQYAQAFPNQGQPGMAGRPNQPNYPGPFPPIPPIMSDEQLKANMRDSPPDQRNQVMQDYLKSRGSSTHELPGGGKLIGTPTPDGQGQYTAMPGSTQNITIKGVHTPLIVNPDGSVKMMLPGNAGSQNFKSLSELFEYVRKEEAKDTASQKITEGQSDEITQAIAAGNKAPQLIKSLNTLDTLSKSGDVPRGPFSKYSVAVRQVIDNLGLTKYIPDIASADLTKAETMMKINAELARQAVQSFTNRGTNFELETYMQNNPGILQSKEGMEMLLDVLRQEYRGIQEIGKIANSIAPGDVATFNAKITEYYEKNPIVITGPIVDPATKKVIDPKGRLTTRNITGPDDAAKVPSGQYFMLPSGKIGRAP